MKEDLVQKHKQDIELTELAYSYSKEEYDHNELVNIISQNDEIKKQICIINLKTVNSLDEAKILVSNLTNHPTPVREFTSYKILDLIKNNNLADFFQDEQTLNIFIDAITDINPSVSRNIIETLPYIKNRTYCLNKIKPKILKLITEINDIPQNKSYLANKKNFSLYWYLEALFVFLSDMPVDDEIIKILNQTSLSGEYTIREKCAKIVSKFRHNEQLKEISSRLQNDENFYVIHRLK